MESVRWSLFVLMVVVIFVTSIAVKTTNGIDSILTVGFQVNTLLTLFGIVYCSILWFLTVIAKIDLNPWKYFVLCCASSLLMIGSMIVYRANETYDVSFVRNAFIPLLTASVIYAIAFFVISLPLQWIWTSFISRLGWPAKTDTSK